MTASAAAGTATGTAGVIAENFEVTLSLDHPITNALLKHDLATGTVEVHEFGAGCTAGEAVFVPSAPEAGEDDGYVMAFVHDPDRGAADLVILAAQDFTANRVASVHLPARIPLGFHSNWIPDPASAE